MTLHILIVVVYWCLTLCWWAYSLSTGFILSGVRIPFINMIWTHTKYPALVGIMAYPFYRTIIEGDFGTLDTIMVTWAFIYWWLCRNIGDDEWKNKFKKKAKEIIKSVEDRLVVVPDPSHV